MGSNMKGVLHRPRRPYIWSRAYSLEQVEKIYDVTRMRRDLSAEIAAVTKFARCQLRDPKGWYNVGHSFDGIWQGEPVVFDPVIRPLYLEYGTRLYELAAREALESFPRMAEHVIEDGHDLGERRLYFTTGQHDLVLVTGLPPGIALPPTTTSPGQTRKPRRSRYGGRFAATAKRRTAPCPGSAPNGDIAGWQGSRSP